MKEKILLTSNNVVQSKEVEKTLINEYEVFVAHSAKEGIEIVSREQIKIVFSELNMIEPDGIMFLDYIKRYHPSITRIILGGEKEEIAVLKAIQANVAKTCILKPWSKNINELINKIIETEKGLINTKCKEFFNDDFELPTIDVSYQKIIGFIDNDAEMEEVAGAIERDPAMAANILRIANSAYYGIKSSSIKQAVIYLGLRNIRELVLSTSIFHMFTANNIPERVFQPLWHQAFLSSKIVSIAYKSIGKKPPVYAATAGLLLNVGIIFMLKRFGSKYISIIQQIKQQAKDSSTTLEKLEMEAFGVTHSTIGGYLLNFWEIPYPIVESVLYHDDPFNLNVIDKELICIMHIAQHYSSEKIQMERYFCEHIDACFVMLGLSKSVFESKLSEL